MTQSNWSLYHEKIEDEVISILIKYDLSVAEGRYVCDAVAGRITQESKINKIYKNTVK